MPASPRGIVAAAADLVVSSIIWITSPAFLTRTLVAVASSTDPLWLFALLPPLEFRV